MVVFTFFILDKNDIKRFFKENFLFADINLDVVLEILLLTISNTDIDFQTRDLQ